MRSEIETPAREALKTWLSGQGRGAQAKLSRALRVTDQLVSQWLSGQCRPNELCRRGLEDLTEGAVVVTEWDTPEEGATRRSLEALGKPEEKPVDPPPAPHDGKAA